MAWKFEVGLLWWFSNTVNFSIEMILLPSVSYHFFGENTPWLRSHFTTPSWHIVGKVCPINNLETLDAQYQNWLYPLSTLTITFHISNIWKTCLKMKQTCYSAWKCFFLRSVFPRPILEIRILFQSHREKKCPIKSSSFLCPIGHGPSPF